LPARRGADDAARRCARVHGQLTAAEAHLTPQIRVADAQLVGAQPRPRAPIFASAASRPWASSAVQAVRVFELSSFRDLGLAQI
jgi:hypothetical protein